jgi:hypothetical protein
LPVNLVRYEAPSAAAGVDVAGDGEGRDGDRRRRGEPRLVTRVLRCAGNESQAPAVVVNNQGDVVGVVERRGRPVVDGGVEPPRRRGL